MIFVTSKSLSQVVVESILSFSLFDRLRQPFFYLPVKLLIYAPASLISFLTLGLLHQLLEVILQIILNIVVVIVVYWLIILKVVGLLEWRYENVG